MCGARGTVASIKGSLSRRPDPNLAPLLPGSVAGGRALSLCGTQGMAGVTKITAATFCGAPSIMPGTREIVTKHDPEELPGFPPSGRISQETRGQWGVLTGAKQRVCQAGPETSTRKHAGLHFPSANDTSLVTALAGLKAGLGTGSRLSPPCLRLVWGSQGRHDNH